MENLKRIFTMALALVMMLGMMTVPTTASSFSDADDIVNEEAVAITAGLGLFAGTTDGRFDPTGTVTRAQMATIIVKMLRGADFNANNFKGVDKFSDTADFEGGWAEGYINACAEMGIVSGYGDGSYKPGKAVTTAEALTMIINALKVDAGQGEWPSTVMAKAEEMKLYGELASKPGTYDALTRDELAVLTYEGLCYSPSGVSGYKIPGVEIVFTDIADAMKANGSVTGITEVVGEDALANQIYELKISKGFITDNQAAGEDFTVLTLADGTKEYYNVETGLDMMGHYVTVYYCEQYKNDNEPGQVYTIVDGADYVTVTEAIDSAKEYRAAFGKNYVKADDGWYFDGSYTGVYQQGSFAISGYVPGQSAPEGTYVIYDSQVRGYIAPTAVTASRVTMVNKSIDNEYIMLSGVQSQLSIAEGDDVVTAYDGIAIEDLVTFVNAQGRYILTKMESVTGTISKHGTNQDGEIVITVGGKDYTDFGSANNNFTSDSSVKTLINDIANVDYEQTYTFYLAPDDTVVCYEEADGVSFNMSDTVYLLGSITAITEDGYGAYNKNNYARGIDMNGDEVLLLLGTTRGTDKQGNGGSETFGSMTQVAAGFYTVKASSSSKEKEYNIQKLTAFNSNSRIDKPYTMSYTSGIGWNFTGKLTSGGRTYGKTSDTRFLVLDDAVLTDVAEFSASMTQGSCSVWLAEGQRMDCIVSEQTNGTHLMEVCIIHTQTETAANEMVYVSQYNNTPVGQNQSGYVYKAYNAKNGDEREITLNTGATLTAGFYSVSTGADGLNTISYLSAYAGASADTNDNGDDFYYYNFFYDNTLSAYDGSTIWTDGVVTNETCTDAVPVVDDRDAERIAKDGVPRISSLKDIIALWTSQPDVTVSLDICYYSGGRRVSAIFVRNIGTALVDSNDMDTVIYIPSSPLNSAVTGVVVAANGDPKTTYAVGDTVALDPAKVVLLDCSGACWGSDSCNGFFSIVGATPEGIKFKHLRATDSKGTIADHNVITGWDGNDQVATFDAHRALTACGYYCYTTTLDQTEASFYLDLSGDPAVTVIDVTGSGIDSLSALKSAAQTAVAAPGSSNGILISYYMADGGMTPDVIIVNATNASMQTDGGKNIWMASPGETVYLPGGRTNATSVADDEGEKNGAFARWANEAWSLDGTQNGYLYTMSAFIPDFGVEGFYTVGQMASNSIITLTYVDVQEQVVTAATGVPAADTYFQDGKLIDAADIAAMLQQYTGVKYITCTADGVTTVVVTGMEGEIPVAELYDSTGALRTSGDFAAMMEQAQDGDKVVLNKNVTISECITIDKSVTITDNDTARTITIATSNARAFYVNGGELTITGTTAGGLTIQGCKSNKAAIYVAGELTMSGNITVTGFEYDGTGDDAGGSAIYNNASGNTSLDGVTFTGNSSAKNGGVIYSTGTLELNGVSFTGNSSAMGGGAIYSTGTLTVKGGSFEENTSTGSGGAIYSTGTLEVDGTTFTRNAAGSSGYGGAIQIYGGTATLRDVEASENTARTDKTSGTSVFVTNEATLILDGGNYHPDVTNTVYQKAAIALGQNNGCAITIKGAPKAEIHLQEVTATLDETFDTQNAKLNLFFDNYNVNNEVLSGSKVEAAVNDGAVFSARAASRPTPVKIGTAGKLVAK